MTLSSSPPASASPSFAAQITAEYGVELPFFDGSLGEAQQMAELSGKYLLVYLHCPTHEDTEPFLTQTLTSPLVQTTILDKVVLFGLSVMTVAGHAFALEHHVSVFPALVGLLKQSEMIRFEGDWCADATGMLREWSASVDLWDTQMAQEISARVEREAREAARLSEETALAEMELEDMRRLAELEEREKREADAREASEKAAEAAAAEAQRREEEAAAAAEREKKEAEAKAQVMLSLQAAVRAAQKTASARLPAPPPSDAAADQICVLSVKSLTGKQHARHFWRSDLIDALYDFVLVEEDVDALVRHLENVPADALSAPEGWLQLACGFPPAPLHWEREQTTIGDVRALCPRATVLVRKAAAQAVT